MKKVVIVEADRAINQLYHLKFEAMGFDVRIAYDGELVTKLLLDFKPDAVLLDLHAPELNPSEVLSLIRQDKNLQGTKVIILTNSDPEEASRELGDLNPDACVVKAEMIPAQVVEKVQDLLN